MILFHKGTGTYFDANDGVVVVSDNSLEDAPPDYEMEDIASEFGQPFHTMFIIVVGTAVDRLEFGGPFWDYSEALDFANVSGDVCTIVPLSY